MSFPAGPAIIASYSGRSVRFRFRGVSNEGLAKTATGWPLSVITTGALDEPARLT
jgi:hypothetical protein